MLPLQEKVRTNEDKLARENSFVCQATPFLM